MKTRFALVAAAVCAAMAAWSVRADTEVVDGITWTYTVSGGKASVGGGSSWSPAIPATTAGAIVIPSTLGGYPVTSIGVSAFFYSGLTSVTIPDSVTSIGDRAFQDCSRLTSVTIGNGVTSIGGGAFQGCSSLTSVTIPDSVTSIGSNAFRDCSGLTSVTIPDSVTSIGSSAFDSCSSLTSVTIGNGVTSIDVLAFQGCSSLTSVTIGSGVKSIGIYAFLGCSGYTLVLKTWSLSLLSMIDASISGASQVYCPSSRRFDVAMAVGNRKKILGYTDDTIFQAEIVSAQMRDSDPTVMDVTYIAHSETPTVNVRALAFENGDRSFASVVRPETFIEGTDANIGDGIAANVANRLSWKVPSDWATDLAKVKFEVMAMRPGDLLLPMHFVTIPATEDHPKTIVSVNDFSLSDLQASLSHTPLFSSLLWLYADGESDLSLNNGILRSGGKVLCRNANLDANVMGYLFGKMGYRLLVGSDRAWVNENPRLNLQPSGFRQYAVKTVEE